MPVERYIEVDGLSVPCIDLRAHDHQAARIETENAFAGIGDDRDLKGIVIAGAQPSAEFALSLAKRGIFLLEANSSEPLDTVLERFQRHMRLIAGAARAPAPSTALSPSDHSRLNAAPQDAPRTDSVFAQKPAQFNPAAYDDWMAHLSKPWHDGEA